MSEERKIAAVKHMSSGRSLKELATHLGLSQTTVSRVINHSGGAHRISEATQKRVLAAAAAPRPLVVSHHHREELLRDYPGLLLCFALAVELQSTK